MVSPGLGQGQGVVQGGDGLVGNMVVGLVVGLGLVLASLGPGRGGGMVRGSGGFAHRARLHHELRYRREDLEALSEVAGTQGRV